MLSGECCRDHLLLYLAWRQETNCHFPKDFKSPPNLPGYVRVSPSISRYPDGGTLEGRQKSSSCLSLPSGSTARLPGCSLCKATYHPLEHDGGLIDCISEGDVRAGHGPLVYAATVAGHHVGPGGGAGLALPQHVQSPDPELVGGAW